MDQVASYYEVVRISAEFVDPINAWATLVAYLESVSGTPLPDLRTVDVQADLAQIQRQIERLVQSEPPPENLKAVYFGLFDTSDDDDNRGIGFYVSGVEAFDTNDGDSLCSPAWWPEGRYLSSASLDAIKAAELAAGSSEKTDLHSLLGYAGQLGAALIVVKFAAGIPFTGLKRVVGFDSGDFVELPA